MTTLLVVVGALLVALLGCAVLDPATVADAQDSEGPILAEGTTAMRHRGSLSL